MLTGIEGMTLTLKFAIDDADPAITLDDISWHFTSLGTSEDITNSQNQHYAFSQDKLSLTLVQMTTAQKGEYTLSAVNSAGVGSETITVLIEG